MENMKKESRIGRKWFEGFTESDVDTLVLNTLLTTGGTAALGCEFGLTGVIIGIVGGMLFFGIGGYRNAVAEIRLRNKKTEQY